MVLGCETAARPLCQSRGADREASSQREHQLNIQQYRQVGRQASVVSVRTFEHYINPSMSVGAKLYCTLTYQHQTNQDTLNPSAEMDAVYDAFGNSRRPHDDSLLVMPVSRSNRPKNFLSLSLLPSSETTALPRRLAARQHGPLPQILIHDLLYAAHIMLGLPKVVQPGPPLPLG